MVARLQAAKRVAREEIRLFVGFGAIALRRELSDPMSHSGLWPLSNIEIQDCRRNDAFDARSGQGLANG